jgi:uncharacterized protein YqeY
MNASRRQMKADLINAMKSREHLKVATLRSVLAALDNAEAVPVSGQRTVAEPVIGQSHEVPRKVLSEEEITQIIQREIDERKAASTEYLRLGQLDEAARLQSAAALIAAYLQP